MQKDDSQLIQACLDGDERAWKEFVERYSRLVYSIPLRYGLGIDDADDVFQNVFTIVFRQLSKLRKQAALAAWLITITHRESLRVAKLHHPHDDLSEEVNDTADPPPERVENWERQHLVRETLSHMESPCREILIALFLENPTPSYEKIAERLNIPIGSIGPTRARCFKKFESLLVAKGFDRHSA